MDQKPDYVVRIADWRRDETDIARIRRAVFIDEQGVPEALEWEVIDPDCAWFVALNGREMIGIVRLMPEGRIGRMAVLPGWRRSGVGRALMHAVLSQARKDGVTRVFLSAQVHALTFYAHFGFVAAGDVYLDAGIPHRTMYLQAPSSAQTGIVEQEN